MNTPARPAPESGGRPGLRTRPLVGGIVDGLFLLVNLAFVVIALVRAPGRWSIAAATPGEPLWPHALGVAAALAGALALGLFALRLARPAPRSGPISPVARALRRFRDELSPRIGAQLVWLMLLAALLAPQLAPHSPTAVGVGAPAQPPGAAFLLGTDAVGRDILSRLLHGARISLPLGVLAALIATGLGAAVGAVAGYAGGWFDRACLGLIDLLMALPRLVLLLAAVALFGGIDVGRFALIALILGLTGWMTVARVVRGQVLSLRERPFVLAARASGLTPGGIVARHVLPGVAGPVVVHGTLMVGSTILLEAALSFLGLGVPLPTATWGNMVGDGMDQLSLWWLSLFPGLAITLTVLGFHLLGDGLRATRTLSR